MESYMHIPVNDTAQSVQTCHTQHHLLGVLLSSNEQDIDQMLTLLTELPATQGVTNRIRSYQTALSRLKTDLRRLRQERICDGTLCLLPEFATCSDPHFGQFEPVNVSVATLMPELRRVRENCSTFLAGLMELNLI